MHHRIIRIISLVVLFFFCWTFGGLFEIAYAVKNSSEFKVQSTKLKRQKKQRPEEKLQKRLKDIEQILADITTDTSTKKNKLKTKKTEIESLDIEIKKQFEETEKKLKDAGLPKKILKRHYEFVKKYEDNLNELKRNLDAIGQATTKKDENAAIEKTKKHLEKIKPPKKHKPLDPNKLPNRTVEPVFKEPRIKKEEFKSEQRAQNTEPRQKPILLASNGSLTGILPSESDYLNLPLPFAGEGWGEGETPDSELTTPNLNFPNSELSTSNSELFLLAAADPPTSDDLSETIEVQFTEAITAKAAELEHKPVKIYNWVRNNIEFVPTYGSIQGADMCLQTKQCNAFDTASLLIALIRASNIPARYVEGTIELPIEKVKNWAGGFTDPMAAIELMAAGGIPIGTIRSGGKIVKVQIEHIWVEAWIDYIPSRGARHKTGKGDTWIRLDASFKQYKYTEGIDIQTAVPFDAETFIDQIQQTATINEEEGYVTGVDSLFINQTMTDYQTQVEDYINQNYPDAKVGEVLGKKEIVQQEFPYLLGTLPYRTIVTGQKTAEIPDSMRHKVKIKLIKDIYDDFSDTYLNITKSLPEIAGKKITLSYSPATQADEDIINTYLPEPHQDGTPIDPSELPTSLAAYLINLKPELRINGEIAATGTEAVMGNHGTLTMTFTAPNKSSEKVLHYITAGEYYGIAIDQGNISEGQMQALKTKLEETKAKLEAEDFTNLTKDDILGDLLYTTALSYFAELDAMNHVQAKTMGIANIRLPSEAVFSFKLDTIFVFGSPWEVSAGGLAMDVGRNISARKALDGDNNKTVQFVLAAGMNSSALEHSVPEQLFSTPENSAEGISAVKALKIANDQGIPIYTIDQSNIDLIIPQLQVDYDVLADIQNAVNAGKTVTVSQTDINFNGWTGVGYIIIDPITGNGAYMISGGLNGAIILIAIVTIFLMYALLPAIIGGGAVTLFGVAFVGGGIVIEAILASAIILLTKLFFIFYLTNKDFREWIQTECRNIADFLSQTVEEIIRLHPLRLLVEVLSRLCEG